MPMSNIEPPPASALSSRHWRRLAGIEPAVASMTSRCPAPAAGDADQLRFAVECSGSRRPSWPPAFAAAIIARIRRGETAIGFSHSTCLPARSARIVYRRASRSAARRRRCRRRGCRRAGPTSRSRRAALGEPSAAAMRFALLAWPETSAVSRATLVARRAGISCVCVSLPMPTSAKPMRRPARTARRRAGRAGRRRGRGGRAGRSAAPPAATPVSHARRVGRRVP